jgi:hypothetical protein
LDLNFTVKLQEVKIWYDKKRNLYTTIPNHPGEMPEGTLRAILRQAGITPDEFLKMKN